MPTPDAERAAEKRRAAADQAETAQESWRDQLDGKAEKPARTAPPKGRKAGKREKA